MVSAPTRKPEASDVEASVEASVTWTTQIGPELSGNAYGYYYAPSATFYVSLGQGTPSTTYVWYLDSNNNWQQVPNNQVVTVPPSPNGIVYWFYNAPSGVTYKFLMGPA
jgi:hypothetical protein